MSGTLTKLCVEEGQTVRRGQVLFIIDQVPYLAALRTAEANVEAARAGVATSQLTYDSKKELYAQKVISEFDLKTSYNSLLTAKAQLAQAEAQQVVYQSAVVSAVILACRKHTGIFKQSYAERQDMPLSVGQYRCAFQL